MTHDLGIWLVWSNEHRAWWGPGRHGYVTDTDRAGRYTEVEATQIVQGANRFVRGDVPNEIMVLAPPHVDTSDIPETREAWFERARLLMVQLQDPVVVHINMLRGTIAKLTWEQVKHLYPEQFRSGAPWHTIEIDPRLLTIANADEVVIGSIAQMDTGNWYVQISDITGQFADYARALAFVEGVEKAALSTDRAPGRDLAQTDAPQNQ